MQHPFGLDLSTLKSIDLRIAVPLVDQEAETIQGSTRAVSQTLTAPQPPHESGEDGGGVMTTMAVGEEGGGDHTTLPRRESGCSKAGYLAIHSLEGLFTQLPIFNWKGQIS